MPPSRGLDQEDTHAQASAATRRSIAPGDSAPAQTVLGSPLASGATDADADDIVGGLEHVHAHVHIAHTRRPAGPRRRTAPPRRRIFSALLNQHCLVLAFIALVAALTCPVLAAPVEVGQPTGRSKADADVTGSTPEWDTETRAAVRAAFAAVVDPVGSWAVDAFEFQEERPIGPGGAPAGWGSHFSLMFGFGGEGSMSVAYKYEDGTEANASLPHRPAAFPNFLTPESDLPIVGTLVPFVSLPAPNSTHKSPLEDEDNDADNGKSQSAPEHACVPRAWPPIRPKRPKAPYVIALVERGGDCDFATKVYAAQERGAAAVVVGDKKLRQDETDEEGRQRENLLTMFSPADTSDVIIPSVFVSRASYLLLRDLLLNQTRVPVDIGPADDDGNALGSLLTFALLMPTLFLLITVTAHRVRVARQREANRAPPTVVLSLPERIWSPDIVWEKDSDESDKDEEAQTSGGAGEGAGNAAAVKAVVDAGEPDAASGVSVVGTVTDSTVLADDERDTGDSGAAEQDQTSAVKTAPAQAAAARKRGKARRKSRTAKRYYSKDECAICMDNFHRGEVVRILPCGHVFHKDECDEWLLKWRKLCPTCRADVTVTPNDLSASATLTPVVDPAATPPAEELAGSWRETLQAGFVGVGARAEAAATAVGGAFRAAVDRVAPRRNNVDERTPLLGTGASAQTQTPIPTRPNAHAP